MKKHLSAKAKWLVVIAVLLAGLLTVSSAVKAAYPGESLVQSALTPFRSAASALVRQVERYYDYVFRYESLQAENEALKKQIIEMEEGVRSADSLQRENERLHQLLGLTEEHEDYKPVSAYIISWEDSNWKSAFTIGKGTNSGIQKGHVAITEYGQVVGQVTAVGSNWATVTTVLDSGLGISATVASTGYNGVVEGALATGSQGLMSTAAGSGFQISGPMRLAFTKNGSFYDIDQGAAPDIPLQFPESFYDRAALTDTINSIR